MSETEQNAELQVVGTRATRVTVTNHMHHARKLIAVVNALIEEVPYPAPEGPGTVRFIRSKVGVPKQFVDEALGRSQTDDELRPMIAHQADAARDWKDFVDSFGPLRALLRVAYKHVDWAIRYKEAELASFAQKVFGVEKTLALDSDDVTRTHIVQEMRHARKRRPKKRKRDPESE